jgi:hypothetical protein
MFCILYSLEVSVRILHIFFYGYMRTEVVTIVGIVTTNII